MTLWEAVALPPVGVAVRPADDALPRACVDGAVVFGYTAVLACPLDVNAVGPSAAALDTLNLWVAPSMIAHYSSPHCSCPRFTAQERGWIVVIV